MGIKLVDLEAVFLVREKDGDRRTEVGPSGADVVMFTCPKCRNHQVKCWMPHVEKGIFPGPGRWDMWGTCIGDLSLRPSVHLNGPGCWWHGFVGNGEASIL